MPVYNDDQLWLEAPNIQVQVGTPSPIPPEDLPSVVTAGNIFTILSIASRGTEPIGKDTTNDLISRVKKGKPPPGFLIKNYADPSATTAPSPPPPPSSPSTALLASSSDPSKKYFYIPDLPPDLPFDEIKYAPRDLVGVMPPQDPKSPMRFRDLSWDPFMKSMLESFKDSPSAIYIDEIKSCISTPYFSPEAMRHRNGILGDSRTVDYPGTTYLWEMRKQSDRRKMLEPRTDETGAINVVAQPRNAKKPRETILLDPGKWEREAGIENGKSLNAFSLIFGITPGQGSFSQAGAYRVRIGFGDVMLTIYENQEEVHIEIKGKNPPEKMMIKPTVGSVLTSGYGNKVYILSFIPVWNGMLISYGIPGSSDWGNTVRFVPIDKDLDINKAITEVINPPPKSDYDIPDPEYIPKTIVMRDSEKNKGKRYKTPGIRIVNSKTNAGSLQRSNTGPGKPSKFTTGTSLGVNYFRCGGALKFVPLYFPQFSRYHFIYPGAASNEDLTAQTEYVLAPPPPPLIEIQKSSVISSPHSDPPTTPRSKKTYKKIVPKPLNQNVFFVPSYSTAVIMPIFAFQSGSFLDFRKHLTTIIRDKQAPFSCFSMEFKSYTPDVRVPIQVWGAVFADNVVTDAGFVETAPPNADGTLSAAAISVPRIRSVNVQRGLDGASGDIVWDRFDPLTQTVDPRPIQEVGGIQIQVTGGANTRPGVIFTGIAYGNAEEDNLGENTVRIPLKGRESKLSSEGGIVLVNVPFFDGHDHREAMNYMAVYGGFPVNIDLNTPDTYQTTFGGFPITMNLATPFRLISSYNINNPVIDFPMGTPVQQAMDTICQYAGTLYYFNRLGICIYIDVEKSTGVNWYYPGLALESFSDEPDHTWVRNQILIVGLIAYQQAGNTISTDPGATPTQAVVVDVNLDTYPKFAWKKGALFAIPQIVRDASEFQRQAVRIAQGQSRPRSSARCRIPGNALIELLDTVTIDPTSPIKWLVVSISHQIDLQRKTWSTELGVELFASDIESIISVDMKPLTDIE